MCALLKNIKTVFLECGSGTGELSAVLAHSLLQRNQREGQASRLVFKQNENINYLLRRLRDPNKFVQNPSSFRYAFGLIEREAGFKNKFDHSVRNAQLCLRCTCDLRDFKPE